MFINMQDTNGCAHVAVMEGVSHVSAQSGSEWALNAHRGPAWSVCSPRRKAGLCILEVGKLIFLVLTGKKQKQKPIFYADAV